MYERELRLLSRCAAIAALLPASAVKAEDLAPFRTTNLNPPLAIIGLPVWAPVPAATAVGGSLEVANHYRLSQSGDDALLLDGETSRFRAWLEKPIGRGWSLGFDVAVYHQSGGSLDDLVDAWHSAFSLPDGGRNYRPEGQLEFRLADAGGEYFELLDTSTGLGDFQLTAARGFGESNSWTLRATLKLPTGDEDILAGSGSTDLTLTALRLRRGQLGNRAASYFLGAAWIEIGEPEVVRFHIEDRAIAGVLGGALSLGQRYGIKGQIDVSSALYDTALEEIGQTAAQLTLGGWFAFREAMSFEFAVSEDLHVSTSPDVVIVLGLRAEMQ
jgi:hypothetical protein